MLNNIYFKLINSFLVQVYKKNVKKYGFTPRGLFGTLKNLQENRFKIINDLLSKYTNDIDQYSFKIADVGCGYGDLHLFFKKSFSQKFCIEAMTLIETLLIFVKILIK